MTAKKKLYHKEEVIEPIPEPESKLEEKKEEVLKNEFEKHKVVVQLKREIAHDKVVKDKKPVFPKEKRGRPKKEVKRDEDGNRLTKKGTIDKRAESGPNNLKKSKVYLQILENKKLKEQVGKVAVLTPYVDSSDSETEFDEVKLEIEPEQPEKPVRSGTDDFIRKQELERERQLSVQMKNIENENKKLKDSFHYNSHLNRLQTLSTNVKLKF